MKRHLRMLLIALSLAAAGLLPGAGSAQTQSSVPQAATPPGTATAIFAGGCFWCTEADFEKLPGVIAAESGYTGGRSERPTYLDVSAGDTGHAEAVRVTYDPARISYAQLLSHFWRTIDPTVKDRQFCDSGTQYRSAIYYSDAAQRKLIEDSRDALLRSGIVKVIHTEIAPQARFHLAEDYHQDYYKKNPIRYKLYRSNCGRDARLAQIWGPPR